MKKIKLFVVLGLIMAIGAQAATVDLSTLTADKTLNNGDVLKGVMKTFTPVKISIAAGATIYLESAVINGTDDNSCNYAGLTCKGNATIVLRNSQEGFENRIIGFYRNNPGIYVPSGSTLTIESPDDSYLYVGCNNYRSAAIGGGGYFSSTYSGSDCGNIVINGGNIISENGGIGSGNQKKCGNITINGGRVDVVASAGAAIGSGRENGECGNITIKGGILNLEAESSSSVIGCGYSAKCGDIVIENTVDRLVAKKGNLADRTIGLAKGSQSSCGKVIIDNVVYTDGITESPFIYPKWDGNLANVTKDAYYVEDGTTITGELPYSMRFTTFTIVDDATVTLDNANMWVYKKNKAALFCEGNANIILKGKNYVRHYSEDGSAIDGNRVRPNNQLATITFSGDGELEATGKHAPAIGGADCGNIVLDGGSYDLGSSSSYQIADIGCGDGGNCADITITKNITSLRCWNIGKGDKGWSCGLVTIGGVEFKDGGFTGSLIYEPAAVAKAEGYINAIGTVEYTAECKKKINIARGAYNTQADRHADVLVSNYQILVNAEDMFANLRGYAISDAVNAIDAIGVVEYTPESKAKIDAARAAYDKILDEDKGGVINGSALLNAETSYEFLKAQAEAASDKEMAELAMGYINAIGTVEYTAECWDNILKARNAYDALSVTQQALVTNYQVLTDAEARYAELKKQAEDDAAAVQNVIDLINAIGNVEDSEACKGRIDAARAAYDALRADLQALVTNYAILQADEIIYDNLHPEQGIQNVQAEGKAVKVLRNGQLFILRADKAYNVQGQLVK